jgi:hypothetical protein
MEKPKKEKRMTNSDISIALSSITKIIDDALARDDFKAVTAHLSNINCIFDIDHLSENERDAAIDYLAKVVGELKFRSDKLQAIIEAKKKLRE